MIQIGFEGSGLESILNIVALQQAPLKHRSVSNRLQGVTFQKTLIVIFRFNKYRSMEDILYDTWVLLRKRLVHCINIDFGLCLFHCIFNFFYPLMFLAKPVYHWTVAAVPQVVREPTVWEPLAKRNRPPRLRRTHFDRRTHVSAE
jgi:hypothetical protein